MAGRRQLQSAPSPAPARPTDTGRPCPAGASEGGAAAAAPGPHDPNYDPDLIPGVETGEDVIRFYGKYGHDSPVKFFYCNRWAGARLLAAQGRGTPGGSACRSGAARPAGRGRRGASS